MSHVIRKANADDAGKLADLAAVTFPLACPPGSPPEDIAAHLANTLSEANFRDYLADPDVTVLVLDARRRAPRLQPAGRPPGPGPGRGRRPEATPSTELSKCYVHPDHHGLGAAAELMRASIAAAAATGARGLWLGVNSQNARAIRFYEKSGFRKVGTKSFRLGNTVEHDFVMEHPLAPASHVRESAAQTGGRGP